jgi:hypothetical protein
VRRLLPFLALLTLTVSCRGPAEVITVGVGEQVFAVEVVRTPEARNRGLMHRSSLARGAGMLFVFERDMQLQFWMKNTRIPLSIAFLTSGGRITEIREMRPGSLDVVASRLLCRYALEVNQGAFEAAGARAGDTLRLPEGFR